MTSRSPAAGAASAAKDQTRRSALRSLDRAWRVSRVAQTTLEPTVATAEPRRRRADTWLAVSAAVFAASELLPWQRTCNADFLVHVHAGGCFSVRGWQGNAALLGMLALVAALVLLVDSLGRRPSRRLGSSRFDWAVISVFVASASLKWLFTQGAASTVGCWLGGLAVGIAMVSATRMVRAVLGSRERPSAAPSRRAISLAIALPLVLVTGAAIPYQATGLARWGGPRGWLLQRGGRRGGGRHGSGRTLRGRRWHHLDTGREPLLRDVARTRAASSQPGDARGRDVPVPLPNARLHGGGRRCRETR